MNSHPNAIRESRRVKGRRATYIVGTPSNNGRFSPAGLGDVFHGARQTSSGWVTST